MTDHMSYIPSDKGIVCTHDGWIPIENVGIGSALIGTFMPNALMVSKVIDVIHSSLPRSSMTDLFTTGPDSHILVGNSVRVAQYRGPNLQTAEFVPASKVEVGLNVVTIGANKLDRALLTSKATVDPTGQSEETWIEVIQLVFQTRNFPFFYNNILIHC